MAEKSANSSEEKTAGSKATGSGVDLKSLSDLSFGPDWASGSGKPSKQEDYSRFERNSHRGGGRSGGGKDRRPARPPRGPAGGGGGSSTDGGRDRRGERGSAPARGEGDRGRPRSAMPPAPFRPVAEINFYPQDEMFAVLVARLKSTYRTYQLFEIANLILEKPERLVVVVGALPSREKGEPTSPVYYSVPDHLPFLTEEEAVEHVLKTALDQFFTIETVEVDPPKGNFIVVNRCGLTGELLGPPNYHKYNSFVQEHFTKRIHNMPFERFQSRIETVKDPEVIEQWLTQMKQGQRYTEILPELSTAEEQVEKPEGQATVVEPEAATDLEAEAPIEPEATAEPENAPVPAEDAEVEPTEASVEASAPAHAPAPDEPTREPRVFDSLEAVRAYLLAERKRDVVGASELVRFPGKLMKDLPEGQLKTTILNIYERQKQFPLDTANNLRGRLRREKFAVYKKGGTKGVSFVCAVKRNFRLPGTVFSESISSLIAFIEENPKIKVSELTTRYLGIGSSPSSTVAGEQAATDGEPVPSEGGGEKPSMSPEDEAKLKQMTRDLHWLVTEGYVAEFGDGSLFAHPPQQVPASASASVDAKKGKIEEVSQSTLEESVPEAGDEETDKPEA